MKKSLGAILAFGFYYLAFASPALAKDWSSCLSDPNDPNSAATLSCLPIIFSNIINWALILAGSATVFLIIFAGIKFITSGGDPKQVQGARQTATWAIIGLLVILFSFAIVNIIAGVTGVNCIKEFGFTNCQ